VRSLSLALPGAIAEGLTLRHAIEIGALRTGDQLPGMRKLAEELVMNPNTVARAYREMEHAGSSSCDTAPAPSWPPGRPLVPHPRPRRVSMTR
jgi:DNA-binding transcriptional MocR family regulator